MAWTEINRRHDRRDGLRYESDTTDAEWFVMQPILPPASAPGRPRATDMRTVIDAILYIASPVDRGHRTGDRRGRRRAENGGCAAQLQFVVAQGCRLRTPCRVDVRSPTQTTQTMSRPRRKIRKRGSFTATSSLPLTPGTQNEPAERLFRIGAVGARPARVPKPNHVGSASRLSSAPPCCPLRRSSRLRYR
jgi:transposase